MKTPKQEAEELVNEFRMVLMNADTECGNEILCTSIAIRNSMKCVNKIIESIDPKNTELSSKWNRIFDKLTKM